MHMSRDDEADDVGIGLVRRKPVHDAARVPLKLVRNESASLAARNESASRRLRQADRRLVETRDAMSHGRNVIDIFARGNLERSRYESNVHTQERGVYC